jgi:SAP domain-containing new25/Domain of unknown function (DUF6434)
MRPALSNSLSSEEFSAWYWLKAELLEFCRDKGLSLSGSKPELAERIKAHLNGETAKPVMVRKQAVTSMPTRFTLKTVIGEGWRCNLRLGAFFKQHCGKGFRLNAAMRDFIHHRSGEKLAQAIECYHASVSPNAPAQAIIAQNEYNRHTRAYYATHPNATRQEVIAAWWAKRDSRRS